MSQRELTFEEANKLCQSTLIFMCQQNLAEKQRNPKNISSPQGTFQNSPVTSPFKIYSRDSGHQFFDLAGPDNDLDLSKSPHKKNRKSIHKLSIDKESTVNDLLDFSQEFMLKSIEKEDNIPVLFQRESVILHQDKKTSTQLSTESDQKGSQMKGEPEELLYCQSLVKEVKRDLQIKSKGKICKTQEINEQTGQIIGYHFYCKNDLECPFDCFLEYTGKRTSKGEKNYRLLVNCQEHQKECIESEEEVVFMKLTKLIDSTEDMIRKLISQNGELKPKQILTLVAHELGEENHKFIYKGLESKNYHKAAKKYFDNLIYKVKNPMWASS